MIKTRAEIDERRTIKSISFKKKCHLLDVGCGEGSLIKLFPKVTENIQIHHGLDISKSPTISPQIIFKEFDIDGKELPYESNSFDLTYCSHVLEHITNPIKLFEEMARVTKQGGTIILKAPSERSILGSSQFLNVKRYFISNFYDDPTHIGRPWSPQSLLRIGMYLGLKVEVCCYNKSALHFLAYPLALARGLLTENTDIIVDYYWKKIGWESYVRYTKTSENIKFNYKSFKGIKAFGDLNV